jgi:hypothetical protein
MKKLLLSIIALLFSVTAFADCIITCHARYAVLKYDGTHLDEIQTPSKFGELGVVTQGQGYYYEWSNTYLLNIHFYSGYELNHGTGRTLFNDNAIIAVVSWSDGGYSTIVIDKWTTQLQYETEQDILYDDATGLRNQSYDGKDLDGRIWHIELN